MHRLTVLLVSLFLLVSGLWFRSDLNVWLKDQALAQSPAKRELLSQEYIARITQVDGKLEPASRDGVWFNQKVTVPSWDLVQIPQEANVLGRSSSGKWIEVDLNTQVLYAHEGDQIIYAFPISSGLPWFPTVTGDFAIWAKVRAQRMTGGSVADGTFYDLPNVQYVQYFHGAYGLHGAYWHNDFGKPRSHGCVNLRNADAEKLFYWTDPQLEPNEYVRTNIKPEDSTPVVIHGQTPTKIY